MFLNKIDLPYCLVVFFIVCPRFRPFSGTPNDNVLENICSEEDLRSKFSEHLLENFLLACLS